ncbi:hypothetical protein [Chryseobacterium profundimaris]|uniref:Ig-like domain-containing protein n=1 Tax=Chryseobacterium profundimaris TaxID=1387275 RepID=A0ABY1NS90_9FLAO|nr:hypothetical protein [Chryseobacterium profundimaris]SMP16266.1 hypothetical protein SAMN06264346_1042 [Chryseobacterium profundimaris]
MMRTQMMQSVIRQIFRKSGRYICFVFIITSIFNFAQAVSVDSPSVQIHEGISSLDAGKTYHIQAAKDHEDHLQGTIVTGQEHIYIADGTSFYGLNEKSVNTLRKRKASVSPPQESMAKKEPVRKKAITNKPVVYTQLVTSLPEGNTQHHISLSCQAVCVAPGSSAHHFIWYQHNASIVQGKPYQYINQNYHYLFSAYPKNNRSGGGIRPPPFHG